MARKVKTDPKNAVRIEGLRELRRAFKAISPELDREVREYLKAFAAKVAADAARRAPRRTGRLAKSIKPSVTQKQVAIQSRVPYAATHEYGGTIRPRGTPIRIKKSRMMGRAVDAHRDEAVRNVKGLIDHVSRRNGFTE